MTALQQGVVVEVRTQFKCVSSGWLRRASTPAGEKMSQIWPDATSAGSSSNCRIPCSKCVPLRKELDGWDPEDDPWAEHVSHAKV